ncbi:MAG TPA: phage GP46 family protein [Caulobacteraceae bacterium]|nr:phage GP46 family protein [Caulobacteraceae bacterium]
MVDIATLWSTPNSTGDWAMDGASLEADGDLVTAVLISLFTDRQAAPDDVIPDGTADPRGWWGDLGATVPIGSRLWLLDREKQTTAVLDRAHDYIVEALQWLIDDGAAAQIDVTTEWTRPGMLGAEVVISKANGATVALAFDWAWQGLNS